MAYISRALRKIGKGISHLFHRHEPIREYSLGEPGYTGHTAPPEPGLQRHDAATDLPGFDPNAYRYKHKIGEEAPTIGEEQKPEAEHIHSHLGRRPAKKVKKVKKKEYVSGGTPDEEEKKGAV